MIKKLFIVAVIFFIIALGIGAYFLFINPPMKLPSQNGTGNTASSSNSYTPFGAPAPTNQNNSSSQNQPSGSTTSTNVLQTSPIGIPVQLFSDPVGGATIRSTKTDELVRFVERATGHINDISLGSGIETPVTNTTIPTIYESAWLQSGSTTLLRYLDSGEITIKTYSVALVIPKGSGTSSSQIAETQGTFLPDNILSVAVNPLGTKAFYLITSGNGGTGIIANPDGSKPSAIFNSPIDEWLTTWPTTNTITLTTKPSGKAPGYLYFLSTAGNVQRILGGISGLTTLTDPTGTLVAYSDNTPTLHIYNIKTGATVNTGLNTIVDKCVWSTLTKNILYCGVPNSVQAGTYPDAWYQGTTAFADSIYKINTAIDTAISVTSQNQATSLDIMNPILSPKEDFLVFTNKNDLSLWTVRLQ